MNRKQNKNNVTLHCLYKFLQKLHSSTNTQKATKNGVSFKYNVTEKEERNEYLQEEQEESPYAALNMAEWSEYKTDKNDKIGDLHVILPPQNVILPPQNTEIKKTISAPSLPITAPTRIDVKNDKSEYIMNDKDSKNNNNNHSDATNGGKKGIPSVLKICTSHSNPPILNSVDIKIDDTPNDDEHVTPNSDVTLVTPNIHKKSIIINNRNGGNGNINDFNGDLLSYNTWLTCCSIYDETIVGFNTLYPELIKIWRDKTQCQRIPNENDILPIFIRLGGIKSNNIYVIKKNKYLKFWKWFKNCLILVNEIKHLWDSFNLNLFYQRKDAEKALNQSLPGIFNK